MLGVSPLQAMGSHGNRFLGLTVVLVVLLADEGMCDLIMPQSVTNCSYTAHPNTTYLDPNNIIECLNDEGMAHCEGRCDANPECAGFGVYYPLSSGRCCTKRLLKTPSSWPQGESYIKQRSSSEPVNSPCGPQPPPSPPPPPLPTNLSTIFRGNATFPYSKGAMLELLPRGVVVAALQAGQKEADPGQVVLVSTSTDGGRTFEDYRQALPSTNGPQWEPTLYYDAGTAAVWLFYTEGPVAMYVSQSRDLGRTWSSRRLIWNASSAGHTQVWVINRLVVLPSGAWVLPIDLGCGGPTAALALLSQDHGDTWAPSATVPNTTFHNCPEIAVAPLGGNDILGVIRAASVGLLQTRSADGGRTWSPAILAGIDGATSKPAIATIGAGRGVNTTVVAAYNVEARLRMGLAVTRDGGQSWVPWGLIDDGDGLIATFYPTIVYDASTNELLTVYSATRAENGTANPCPRVLSEISTVSGCYSDMRLARTTIP